MSPLMSPNADQTVNDAIAAIRSGARTHTSHPGVAPQPAARTGVALDVRCR